MKIKLFVVYINITLINNCTATSYFLKGTSTYVILICSVYGTIPTMFFLHAYSLLQQRVTTSALGEIETTAWCMDPIKNMAVPRRALGAWII